MFSTKFIFFQKFSALTGLNFTGSGPKAQKCTKNTHCKNGQRVEGKIWDLAKMNNAYQRFIWDWFEFDWICLNEIEKFTLRILLKNLVFWCPFSPSSQVSKFHFLMNLKVVPRRVILQNFIFLYLFFFKYESMFAMYSNLIFGQLY